MGLYIFCILVSSLLGFYLFYYIDASLLLFSTSQAIVFIVNSNIRKKSHLFYILLLILIGAFIAYVSGLRIYFSYSSANTPTISDIRHVDIFAQYIMGRLDPYLSKDSAGLIVALSTGQKEYVHLALADLVRRNGISHLLALSGFHLSLLILGLEYAMKIISTLLKRDFNIHVLRGLTFFAVWGYCIWIGFIPSLYRATLMYSLGLIMKYFFGRSDFFYSWALTAILFLAVYPPVMFEHGFILSMLALLGVYMGAKQSWRFNFFLHPYISSALCMSWGAMLMTTWYSYLFFGTSYPIGLLSSVLLTPFVSLFMLLGIFFILLVYIIEYLDVLVFSIGLDLKIILNILGNIIDYMSNSMIRFLSYFSNSLALETSRSIVNFYIIHVILFFTYYLVIRVQYIYAEYRKI